MIATWRTVCRWCDQHPVALWLITSGSMITAAVVLVLVLGVPASEVCR